MPWAPSTDDLLDLRGVSQRTDGFRFELVSTDLDRIGELAPSADDTPSITNDTGRTIYRSLSNLRLPPDQAADVNPLADLVRAVMLLQDGTEHAIGVFMFGDEVNPERSWGIESQSDLVDQMQALDQPRGVSTGFPKGTNIVNAAAGLLRPALLQPDHMTITPSPQLLGSALYWSADATRVEMATDLLTLIGYWPPYFGNDGWCTLVPAGDPNVPDMVIGPGSNVLEDSISRRNNRLQAPNVYIVQETSGKSGNLIGRYEVPAWAPHSRANRNGLAIVATKNVQGLTSTTQANAAAKAWALSDRRYFEVIEFQTTADPRYDTHQTVSLYDVPAVSQSWRLTCRAGEPMSHTLKRWYL